MKNIKSLGFTMLLLMGTAPSWAAFTSLAKTTVIASAATGGVKTVTFNLSLASVNDPKLTVPGIFWSNVDPAVTVWKVADSMMKISFNITDLNGGIQIYTDNKGAAGNPNDPRFVDPTPADPINPDSDPAGMLYVTGAGQSSQTLPIAWTIKSTGTIAPTMADPNANGANGNPVDVNSYQWLYITDSGSVGVDRDGDGLLKSATDSLPFQNGVPYITMIKQSGIHFGQAPIEFGSDPDHTSYVFFEADFSSALVQSVYRTTRLTVEAYTN